ncbi:MAG: ABC transporter permease, partial [Candidatus Acidiferrales bacterium]
RQALIKLGGVEQAKEQYRARRGLPAVESLAQDIRYGLRMLRKSPGFTAVAVLTLALGIGANTAIFSAIQTALLRPYPFYQPERLVSLWSTNGKSHYTDGLSGPDYLDWKSQSRSFTQVAAYVFREYAIVSIGARQQRRVWTMLSTGNLFATLGIEPALGRSFLPQEQNSNSHVAMLSYALWQSQFAGSPQVIGRNITVDGTLRQIVGILPPRFDPPYEDAPIGVVLPTPWDSPILRDRTGDSLLVVARLVPNTSVSSAQSDLNIIASRLALAYPASNRNRGAQVDPINHEDAFLRDPLGVLFGAVSFVLLIACGNVSGLLLARGLARRKEFAVRAALGASRGRLIRQMLTESLLLALLGGAFGLAGAWEIAGVLSKMGAAAIPALKDLRTDTFTAIFAFAASLAAAAIFGLLPSLKISSFDVNSSLKGSPLANSRALRPAQLRGFLVAAQVALATIVLCGAGVLLRSLHELSSTNPGFNVNHLLTADVSKSASPAAQIAFYDQLLVRVRTIPGILDAAATSAPPLGSDAVAPMPPFDVPAAHSSRSRPSAMVRVVTPGYFRAIGVHILAGREFAAQDSAVAPRVAIVNQFVARQYFKNGDAIGEDLVFYPLHYPARFTPQPGVVRVVGVIPDVKHWFTGGTPHVDSEIYLPYAQAPVADMMLVARFDGRTPAVAHELQKRIVALDPSALLDDPQTMREQFSETLAPNRFYPALLSVFAVIALLLASIGIYGVVSYWVRERTQEIGIRLALGARSFDVLRLVIKQGLVFVLAGAAVGLAAAFALTQFLSTLLYGVKPRDPATFIAVTVLLIAVALLACYIPARRAMRVDPMVALRYE